MPHTAHPNIKKAAPAKEYAVLDEEEELCLEVELELVELDE